MNGIMPGPLWLAIASAANGASPENRNLDSQTPKVITSPGKWSESQKGVTAREESSSVTVEIELHPVNKIGNEKEYDMGNLMMLGQAAFGFGVLFMGVAALWFVSVYHGKKR